MSTPADSHASDTPDADLDTTSGTSNATAPTQAQSTWLRRGLAQSGGKLPLFDENGQQVCERTVRACIDKGWAQPWFSNPLKPDWVVCKLTDAGRLAATL